MVALLNERNADVIFRPRSARTILKALRCTYEELAKGTTKAVALGAGEYFTRPRAAGGNPGTPEADGQVRPHTPASQLHKLGARHPAP